MAEMSEIEVLIGKLRKHPIDAGADGDVIRMREQMERLALRAAPDLKLETRAVNGVEAELITPPGADPKRMILYLHGGGYVMGSPNTHRCMVGELARASASLALLLDYRLAPEHPYPAAVEDSVAAYRWLLSHGYEPGYIVIAGDSAGGGLTAATLLALKEQKLPMPAAGVCISPLGDMTASGESIKSRAELEPMTSEKLVRQMADLYLNGADPKTPGASPIFGDLSGLPPLLIHVGEREILFSDAERLRDRAEEAGVNVTFEEWPDMIHVWHAFHPFLAEGREGIKKVGAFVKDRTAQTIAA